MNTPALRGFQRHLWIASEGALTDAIFDLLETGWSASSTSA